MRTMEWSMLWAIRVPFALLATLLAFTGCQGSDDNNQSVASGTAPGVSVAPGTPDSPTSLPPLPDADPNTMTIAVKYVALKNTAADAASPTQADVVTLLANMSKIWAQCNIRFQLGVYLTPVASDDGLAFYPANHSQLDAARAKYDDHNHALLVKTGTWNRSGNLGADGSNGFSTLPPSNPEGAVFEAWVATSTMLISHETGHLIGGLDHTTSATNLMNHYVSTATNQLSTAQCESARTAMTRYHSTWLR